MDNFRAPILIFLTYSTLVICISFKAFSAQSSWTASWIWTMEIYGHNDKYRVILGLSTLLFWAAGFISSAGIAYLLPNWRIAFLAMSCPTLLFIAYIWIIPESPIWLISKGKDSEAEAILSQVAQRNGVEMPNLELHEAKTFEFETLDHPDQDVNACCSLIATPRVRSRTIIMSFLFFVGSFVYYGLSLNSSGVGGDDNIFVTFTLYGLMEIPAIGFAILSLSSLGRRLPTVFLFLSAGDLK